MNKRTVFLALTALLLLAAVPAVATAAFSNHILTNGEYQEVKFTNFEAFMNTRTGEVVSPDAADDSGNYVLVSVFSATTLQDLSGTKLWGKGVADFFGDLPYLLGYSVQKIVGLTRGGGGVITDMTYANPTIDPFGKLNTGAGEMLRLYESATDWGVSGSVAATVATIGGTLWASFGIDAANANNFASYEAGAGVGGKIGDAEFELDTVVAPPLITLTSPGSDILGNANIYSSGVPVPGEWAARSQDPMLFTAAVPEPATLAMWGGFLAIGAVFALRRRTK